MINKYEIKIVNNEEILYVYLDFNYEFSKISFFKDLKKQKINFKGKKIILIVSGITIATLLLKSPLPDNNQIIEDNYKYVSTIILNDFKNNFDIKLKEEIKENNNSVNDNVSKNNPKIKKENLTAPKKEEIIIETNEKNKEDDLIYITVYRSNNQVIEIELEEYVIGVVGAEMPASFDIEALKAQSILARTYALKAKQTNKKLTDTVSTQSYKDNNQLKAMWNNNYDKYYQKIKNAVNATKGITIKYNGNYIEAVYHSTSNGYTEDSKNVWKNAYPYLVTTESPYDKQSSSFLRETILSYEDISNKLGINITKYSNITYQKNQSNRVSIVTIDTLDIDGIEFRTKLGLRSTDFLISLNEDNVTITTKGFGHGVGMSQYGANEMAKQGKTYQDIIKHYYKGVTLSN